MGHKRGGSWKHHYGYPVMPSEGEIDEVARLVNAVYPCDLTKAERASLLWQEKERHENAILDSLDVRWYPDG
jgi:hypothetical protein